MVKTVDLEMRILPGQVRDATFPNLVNPFRRFSKLGTLEVVSCPWFTFNTQTTRVSFVETEPFAAVGNLREPLCERTLISCQQGKLGSQQNVGTQMWNSFIIAVTLPCKGQ